MKSRFLASIGLWAFGIFLLIGCDTNKKNLDEPFKTIKVADHGRVVHMEYNAAGDEVWVSVWDKKGEIVIYDDKTMKEKKRITGDWLVTPTGKFNVTNTMGDIY